MEGDLRQVKGLVIAANSPVGLVADAINDLTMHLPNPSEPGVCPTCAGRFWPCRYFDDAAHRVYTAQVRVSDVVPVDLHLRLSPPPTSATAASDSRAWPSDTVNEEQDHG